MISDMFNNILSDLEVSPIRKLKYDSIKRQKFFYEEIERTNDIYKIIETNIMNLNNPLKVVLMGEVKAGKSTLLNALVGKEISYTNVVEATATILEVKYGQTEKAVIYKKNNESISFESMKELNEILDENRNNVEYFKNIKNIVVTMPVDRLKEIIIVDTPGLNTITLENAERTENYILNSDVILWIMNGHHLGQSDVNDKLIEVRRLGKPIIAVINRVDEIDADEEELVEYLRDEMGYIFKEIFTLSGRRAFFGIIENDEEKINQSGYKNLNNYLLNNIEKNSANVQIKSIKESSLKQLNREVDVHNFFIKRISEIINGIAGEVRNVDKFNETLKVSILDRINKWRCYELFSKEKDILINSNNYKADYEKYFSEEYLNNIINEKYNELTKYIYSQWQLYSEELINEKKKALKDIVSINDLDRMKFENIPTNESTKDKVIEGGINTATTAGTIGLGLAGYAAWFGPAAAYVSIGSAISSFVPPLLITGLIGGAVCTFLKKNKSNSTERAKMITVTEYSVSKLKEVINETIIKDFENKLVGISNAYRNEVVQNSGSLFNQIDLTMDEGKRLIEDSYKYLIKLKSEIMDKYYPDEKIDIEEVSLVVDNGILELKEEDLQDQDIEKDQGGSIYTKVVGVTIGNRQDLISKLEPGYELSLYRERDNEYDKNAVAVYYCGDKLGYINKNLAIYIAKKMDDEKDLICEVVKVTGGGSYNYGLEILIKEYDGYSCDGYSYDDYSYYIDYDDPDYIIQQRYDNDPCDADPDMCCGYDH